MLQDFSLGNNRMKPHPRYPGFQLGSTLFYEIILVPTCTNNHPLFSHNHVKFFPLNDKGKIVDVEFLNPKI